MEKKFAKQAKGFDGELIHIGDLVQCVSLYDGKTLLNQVKVIELYRQGYDGTILRSETPPDSEYPYHFSHVARMAYKIEEK